MGNLSLHSEVYKYVINQLSKIRPKEEYVYIALGNFLTDLDQFRDPYSNFRAKERKSPSVLTLPILGFLPW
jgi:hypothetical protein